MSKIDQTFKEATRQILEQGETYTNNRRKVTRLQIPKLDLKHDFKDGFPALSLKKLPLKQVVAELIWFLRGDNNTKFLKDNNCNIWDADACNYYNKINGTSLTKTQFQNRIKHYTVGQNYSKQWRAYNGEIDQIKLLIDGMIKDINGSRLIVDSWNINEINETALPPCHNYFQVIGGSKDGFYLYFQMRKQNNCA